MCTDAGRGGTSPGPSPSLAPVESLPAVGPPFHFIIEKQRNKQNNTSLYSFPCPGRKGKRAHLTENKQPGPHTAGRSTALGRRPATSVGALPLHRAFHSSGHRHRCLQAGAMFLLPSLETLLYPRRAAPKLELGFQPTPQSPALFSSKMPPGCPAHSTNPQQLPETSRVCTHGPSPRVCCPLGLI